MFPNDVLCFSHLRWNFVYQRPNHLMSRAARDSRVLFIEEPLFDEPAARLETVQIEPNLLRVVPHLRPEDGPVADAKIASLLRDHHERLAIHHPLHWYYTPMMLPIGRALPNAAAIVYDCMDELSAFLGAPPELLARERELMQRADVVFTGGVALYQAKRGKHRNVHAMPSSVDVPFFVKARESLATPPDQAAIPEPRVGYCGVIDERIDLGLLEALARDRPDLSIVMVGPVVKISPDALPKLPNIHYLGGKPYSELPSYLAGWRVALMPFALNDATRFISPTKTPEYLAAGRPVVSTAISDVVEPYERLGLVRIGRSADEFVAHVGAALRGEGNNDSARDKFLASNSWDSTWTRMKHCVEQEIAARSRSGAAADVAAHGE
jgi:glycosyltransferase involved in cell wall biosynthesis